MQKLELGMVVRLRGWVIPTVMATLVFIGFRPTLDKLALAAPSPIVTGVGVDVLDGYQQVYYVSRNKKSYITSGPRNHTKPHLNSDWVAYNEIVNGAGQILLYNITADTTTQLTYTSTNQNIQLDDGRAVWERWVEDRWQVMFYDGISVRQLTAGDVAVRPDIEGDSIVYAQQSLLGIWTAYKYSISLGVAVPVGVGEAAAWPRLVNGEVVLGFIGL
jgi:hypothetical protein